MESGRTLGAGQQDAEALHIIPIVFVGVASESPLVSTNDAHMLSKPQSLPKVA